MVAGTKKVEVNARINSTPEKIIEAFVNAEMLCDWWDVARSLIEPRKGGMYTLTWNITEKGFGYVSTGIIADYIPGRLLIIENFTYLNPERPLLGPMTLTVRAEKKSDHSLLYICQDGYQQGSDWDWYYIAVKHAWPVVIQSLTMYLEAKAK